MSSGYGQGPVLGRGGRKLVKGNRNCLSDFRPHHQVRTVNTRAALSVSAVAGKLLLHQTVKLGSSPASFDEQSVDVRERLNASLERCSRLQKRGFIVNSCG
jgi:hypothetical protein